MQAESADQMTMWIQIIRASAVDTNIRGSEQSGTPDAGKSTNRPMSGADIASPSTPEQSIKEKKEKKRNSLFGNKKKKSQKGETP